MRNWRPHLADTLAEHGGGRATGAQWRSSRRHTAATRAVSNTSRTCGRPRRSCAQRGVRSTDARVRRRLAPAHADSSRPPLNRSPTPRAPTARRAPSRRAPRLHCAFDPDRRCRSRDVRPPTRRVSGGRCATPRLSGWEIAYQSRSGRPEDPWLEPDINDVLRRAGNAGVSAVVVSPARVRRGSHRGAVRPRCRGEGDGRGNRPAHGTGLGGERSPPLPRRPGRCRRGDDRPLPGDAAHNPPCRSASETGASRRWCDPEAVGRG